jgi:L,D-peptidoglycan transpeptidase YkuD (ErfK/YbiS/YcfS/YnhG family)
MPNSIFVSASPSLGLGTLTFNGQRYRCTLGEQGLTGDKREGDMKTPVGSFPLKEVWYRADRMEPPVTDLPTRIIQKDDGWCDDASSEFYNQPVKLPFEPSHEELWREDEKYDVIVTLGYNDSPFKPGKGSAIFFHIAPEDYPPTQGCVGLKKADILNVLQACSPETLICIEMAMPEAV